MPIEGLSNILRLPRLGKIRLGIKETSPRTGNPYPKALDYFHCPQPVQNIFGEKPTELKIMFPTEDPNQFAQQWLRAYSLTQGLICIGDDEACRRKIDTATGTMASHTTEDWVWKEGLQCDPQECSEYLSRRCRRVMNLQFLLPDVNLCGRISFIPLTLTLEPREVSPPGEKKKVVRVLGIRSDIKLAELQAYGQREPARILLPEPEVEGVPDDSFPTEVLAEEELEPLVEPEPLEAPILNREELIEELAMLLRDQME